MISYVIISYDIIIASRTIDKSASPPQTFLQADSLHMVALTATQVFHISYISSYICFQNTFSIISANMEHDHGRDILLSISRSKQ